MKTLLLVAILQAGIADRAKIDTKDGRVKVSVDGTTLFDGPGAKGVVGTTSLRGETFVTVTVDGTERVRLWASEIQPLRVPDPTIAVAEKWKLGGTREGDQVSLTLTAVVDGKARAPVVIYEGPAVTEPSMETAKGSLEVSIDGVVILRLPSRLPQAAAANRPYTVAEFVDRLNRHRKAAGVPEVKAHGGLTKACDLHALYLCKNSRRPEATGLNAHKELKELPGYTDEGAAVAPNSVIQIFGGKKDLVTAVDSLMATLYHRVAMLEPRLTEVGVGWAFDADGVPVVVMHVRTLHGKAQGPVVYPGDGQKELPLEFGQGSRETPDPVPDLKAQAGYPISIQWDEQAGWKPVGGTAVVRCDGKEIACWVSTPEKPARSDFEQEAVVGIIPKEKLAPGKTYVVEFKCARSDDKKEWSRSWSFTTATK